MRSPFPIFTGSGDLPFCDGDCLTTGRALPNIAVSTEKLLLQTKSLEADVPPNTEHGLNLYCKAVRVEIEGLAQIAL